VRGCWEERVSENVAIIVRFAFLAGLGLLALWLFRWYERLAKRALQRRYEGLAIHDVPEPGDVIVIYHTYHGLFAWLTQTEHHVALSPEDERKLLGRLLKFNLAWGVWGHGAVFVPPLALSNYRKQLRSIADQEAAGALPQTAPRDFQGSPSPTDKPEVNPYAAPLAYGPGQPVHHRSIIRGFIRYSCGFLCVVFAISSIVNLINGEFGIAISLAGIAALFAWYVRDYS